MERCLLEGVRRHLHRLLQVLESAVWGMQRGRAVGGSSERHACLCGQGIGFAT
jgi:hypothetical protein